MAISSSTRKAGPFIGNDATTVFPFAFKVFTAADLRVVNTSALGIESDLVIDVDYTVSLNSNQDSDPGGSVTRLTALPTGERLTITSDVEALQPLVLTNNGGFYPRVINDAFDKITIIAQQLIEQVGRSLKLPISSTASATLPDPVANRLIAWNGSASGFTNVNPADIATVAAYADAYIDLFTGNGTQTAFTLTHDPAVLANLSVSISGVTQVGGEDFTWIGTTLTFLVAPPNGTRIQVRYTRAIPPADLASAVAAAEADRVATAADRVQTGLDRVATAADVVSAEADRVATAADRVATAADAAATAADRAQTGLDRAQTGADVVTAAAILASKQPLDADLTAIAALTSAADKMPYATGAQAWALTDLTSAARSVLDDASVSAMRTTLGVPIYGTLALAEAATVLAEVKTLRTLCRTVAGYGGGDFTRTSLATITSAGYPAAAYFRSTDRFMPDGSTDATNGGYWVNLSETLDFYQFGAVGDATVTNDSAAIIAAILHSKLTGLMLRPVGAFRVEEKIVINCDGFDGTLCTLNVYSTPAIACEISTGDAADPITIFSQSVGRHIVTPVLINMTKPGSGWAGQGTGLRLVNCQNVEVKLNVITNFAIGVQLTSFTQACVHNKLFVSMLLNNKVNVQVVVGDAGGATNSNIFFGGHYVHYSDEGTAVSGCRHIEVVPHATRSVINHTVFDGASLEGIAEDYHVYDGGQQNSYINCRWENAWASGGPRFRQGQSATPQAGQGGDHAVVYGYGVDEFNYLTVTNDTSATTRMTVLGNGLGRRSSSGPIDLQTSVGSGEPVYRGFASADNLNTIDRAARWSWSLSNTGLSGKQTADVYARATYDFVNGGLFFGNGTAAPASGVRAFGSSSMEVVGNTYWPQQALNAGNVGGFGTLSYMNTDKWQTTLATGTIKVFVVSNSTGWTAMTGTGSKAALAAAAAGTASATYVQAELQGALNRIAALEARLKSYDDAFFASNLIA